MAQRKRGPTAAVDLNEETIGSEDTTEGKTGWIVLRFHRVHEFRKVAKKFPQLRPSPSAGTAVDLKPGVLEAQAGAVIMEGIDYGKEPVFDSEIIYEARIRYLSFERIQGEPGLLRQLVVSAGDDVWDSHQTIELARTRPMTTTAPAGDSMITTHMHSSTRAAEAGTGVLRR